MIFNYFANQVVGCNTIFVLVTQVTRITRVPSSYMLFIGDLNSWMGDGEELMSGADPGFGQGGAPAFEAENCRCSEVESRERSEQSVARV